MKDVLGVIMGGGAGTRLYPLTKLRAKPAVPLAGYYRLIDIPISNCIHSGVNRIHILTQFNSVSLHRHVTQTYRFDRFSGGWVQLLAAEQTPVSSSWYQGTADALRKQLYQIQVPRPEDVLILSGDHLYRMDYSKFVQFHKEKEADITIAVKPATADEATRFGILKADEASRIHSFREKPPMEELDGLESLPGDKPYMGSMGIYVFRTKTLVNILRTETGSDFGKHIIPAAIEKGLKVYAYPFGGYWEDIGTIRAFYEVNLELAHPNARFDLYQAEWPIYTRPRHLPGSRVIDSSLTQVLLAPGCQIERAAITGSVVGLRSVVHPGAHLHKVVMMGADYYETEATKQENSRVGLPNIGVGEGSVIEDAILDKNARIGRNVVIRSHKGQPDEEQESYMIRDGIVVIPKNITLPDGTII
ncbi:MAG: glucose-1-phosphate adenylyltransferase [Anaerolineae bacterium]|nr:glucose-1-phosphate adenylyltransferase [Anaerolineae bacterium]